jgi:hypothetical protein
LRGSIHLSERPVEEHAQGHHQVEGAHADDGGNQPHLLDDHAGQERPDRDAGLSQGGQRPEDPAQQIRWVCSWMTVEAMGLMGPNSSPPTNPAMTSTPSGGVRARNPKMTSAPSTQQLRKVKRRGQPRPTAPNSGEPVSAPAPKAPMARPRLVGLPPTASGDPADSQRGADDPGPSSAARGLQHEPGPGHDRHHHAHLGHALGREKHRQPSAVGNRGRRLRHGRGAPPIIPRSPPSPGADKGQDRPERQPGQRMPRRDLLMPPSTSCRTRRPPAATQPGSAYHQVWSAIGSEGSGGTGSGYTGARKVPSGRERSAVPQRQGGR